MPGATEEAISPETQRLRRSRPLPPPWRVAVVHHEGRTDRVRALEIARRMRASGSDVHVWSGRAPAPIVHADLLIALADVLDPARIQLARELDAPLLVVPPSHADAWNPDLGRGRIVRLPGIEVRANGRRIVAWQSVVATGAGILLTISQSRTDGMNHSTVDSIDMSTRLPFGVDDPASCALDRDSVLDVDVSCDGRPTRCRAMSIGEHLTIARADGHPVTVALDASNTISASTLQLAPTARPIELVALPPRM